MPRSASGFALRGLSSCRRLVVTDDETGIAPALVAALAARGVSSEIVRDVPADADGVIVLAGLRAVADVDAAVVVNLEAFRAAKAVAKTVSENGGVFVTVQDTGGDLGIGGSPRAWLSGLTGLVKTVAQEWTKVGTRAIDIAASTLAPDEVARVIADELVAGGVELEVAFDASSNRRVPESYLEAAPQAPLVVNDRSIVVASGGARGVTAECLIALAEASRCSVVLLGRTALADEPAACAGAKTDAELKKALLADAKARGGTFTPATLGKEVAKILANREVRSTIARIERTGGRCAYVVADVQDEPAVKAALDGIRASWGPITGIVHGAGVLADRFILDKTEEQFRSVFDTKVAGLRVLLGATREDPIDTIVLFSSIAARCGNQGQCDYAMANEVLNKVGALERARRGGSVVVKSIGWGPWKGGMVTPQLEARFDALGVPLIPLHQGAAMMVEELTLARPESVELVVGGEPKPEALLAEGADASFRHEVIVSRSSFPALDGHRVKGEVVVPVVLALELCARAARAASPELALERVRDVKVLKGIVVPDFEKGVRLFVTATKVGNGVGATYSVELESEGRKHYRATVELRERVSAPAPVPSVTGGGVLDAPIYGGVLFHGDSFRVIRGVESVSSDGVTASLVGGHGVGWTDSGFVTDPALLDGGLQLALLWTEKTLGGHSLPTSLGALRVFQTGFPVGTQTAVLKAREAKGDRGLCDVHFVGSDGTVVAELAGVETHVLPGTRGASA